MEWNKNEMDEGKELTEKECWFWLDNLQGIGKVKRRRLLEKFQSAKGIFEAKKEELGTIPELRASDIDILTQAERKQKTRGEYQKLIQKGIRFIQNGEEEYPEKLEYIYDSPDVLYVRGKLPDPEKKSIAIVGARNCTSYGIEMAEWFGKELAKAGMEVISGLARGIDSAAHRGALTGQSEVFSQRQKELEEPNNRKEDSESGGTYGILGCGIDQCYPVENLELFMEMQRWGGVISEYGPGVKPRAGNFPLRNRIISGFADAILIVEAKEKSGSLITAQLGLEQGKDIFSIPGRGCDILSKGCNQLIKQGAFLVDSPQDILDYYQIEMKKIWKENKKNENFLDLKWEMVYSGLSLSPKHIHTIMEETNMSLADTIEVLLSLEVRGYIKKVDRNYYVLVN